MDENLPTSLAEELRRLGHDVDTSPAEGLQGQPDDQIWEAARTSRRFLISQDLDFSDLRSFTPGTHAGLLLVRLRHPSRTRLIHRVRELFATEPVEQWAGCFVVATSTKIRIRRPSA